MTVSAELLKNVLKNLLTVRLGSSGFRQKMGQLNEPGL